MPASFLDSKTLPLSTSIHRMRDSFCSPLGNTKKPKGTVDSYFKCVNLCIIVGIFAARVHAEILRHY